MRRTSNNRLRAAAATTAAALLVCIGVVGSDWLHLGLDGWRSRSTPETIAPPFAPAWTAVGAGSYDASPLVMDGVVLVAGRDGMLRAYRELDGAPAWSVDTGAPIVATPAAGAGRTYVPGTDGVLRAFRHSDGQLLWSLATGGANRSSPMLTGGVLYLCSSFPNRKLIALNPATGAPIWEATLDHVCDSSPALAGGRVVVGTNLGSLIAVDAATGAPAWTYSSGGAVVMASPLVQGSSIYFVPGGGDFRFQRIDVDDAQWAAANWTVTLTDPAPPAPATVYETTLATSSPVPAGGRIVFLARFDYSLDLDTNGSVETRRMKEFMIGVDPATRLVNWQVLRTTQDVPDYNGIPTLNLCPTPAVSGGLVFFPSSLDSALEVRLGADGSLLDTVATDGPALASPTLANGRVYAATSTGRLHAFQGANAAPSPPVTNFAPTAGLDVHANTPGLSWDPAADADDAPAALRYTVRIDSDGEVLEDWLSEILTAPGVASATAPVLTDDASYVWRVRTQDASLACSAWSAPQSFSVNLAPQPPGALIAVPGHQKVNLSWQPSPSGNVTGYLLAFAPLGSPYGPDAPVGNVLATEVNGLANGTPYAFRIRAIDAESDVSDGEEATATPVSLISIGATGFGSLQDALDAALPGDTIVLAAGTFVLDETLVVPHGVSIRGVNARDTRLVASGRFTLLDIRQPTSGAVPLRIERLSLSAGSTGIKSQGVGITLQNLAIYDMTDAGVDVEGESDVTALHLTVYQAINAGVRSSGTTSVRNSILDSNGRGVQSLAGAFASRYNVFHANTIAAYDGVSAGPGDVTVVPQYVNAAAGDFTVPAGAPTIDGADPADSFALEPVPHGRRANQGAFGNSALAALSAGGTAAASSDDDDGCFLTAAAKMPPSGMFLLMLSALAALAVARRQRPISIR